MELYGVAAAVTEPFLLSRDISPGKVAQWWSNVPGKCFDGVM